MRLNNYQILPDSTVVMPSSSTFEDLFARSLSDLVVKVALVVRVTRPIQAPFTS